MKNKSLRILLFFCLAFIFIVSLLPNWMRIGTKASMDLIASLPHNNSVPPSSGDWNITDTTMLEDTEYIVNGSIFIKSGGSLILRNSSIYMNLTLNGQYWIDVENGGNLTITNDSLITAYNQSNKYYIRVFNGAKFLLDNSEISYAGPNTGDKRGLYIETQNVSITNSRIHGNYAGVYISSSNNISLINNSISDCLLGVSVWTSNNISLINNSIFDNITSGIQMIISTNGTIINNTFVNCGLDVYGENKENYNHNVANNVINGKPLQYIFNQSNVIINDAGQAIVAYSQGVIMKNTNLSTVYTGAHIYNSNNVSIINNTVFNNSGNAIYVYYSNVTLIENNIFANNHDAVHMGFSNFTVQENNISNNTNNGIFTRNSSGTFLNNTISNNKERGIYIDQSKDVFIINNTISNNNREGILIYSADNVTITNNTFNNGGLNILQLNKNYTIKDNIVNGKPLQYVFNQTNVVIENAGQVIVTYSQDVIIKNVNLSFVTLGAIIGYSNNISMINNTIFNNNLYGIYDYNNFNFSIINNSISNCNYGIQIIKSNKISVINNTVSNCDYGVRLGLTVNLNLTKNTFNNCGLDLMGDDTFYYNHVVAGNIVNGKPLQYVYDKANVTIEDAGQVIVAYSLEITIKNVNLSNASVGAFIYNSNNVILTNSTISYNRKNIYVRKSNNITITKNTISDSEIGIFIGSPSDTIIFLNNFFNNIKQIDDLGAHMFDNGGFGNYWSDYTGMDSDGDGIGDAPYQIDADSIDNYPLIYPYESIPPEIKEVMQYPFSPTDIDNVVVSVDITDETIISQVILNYYDGSVWNNVTMSLNSTNNLYEAQIPILPFRTEVQYKVHSKDFYNNSLASQIYSYIVAASETEPPEIHSVKHIPLTPNNHQQVLVIVNVTDDSNISQVILSYYNGTSWNNVTMDFNSTNILYQAKIPALSIGLQVQYKIYATDEYYNWVESPTYSYTVVASEEDVLFIVITIISLIGAGVAVVSVVIIIRIRRRK